ncbi:extensin family protein [Blastomonas sp.]|uniref:extensin family protein n=1 Tax=Blastomonas sp. TaxID=1909299 RepID=UPI00260E78D1|nr:extensin family protein [Blastomonas sp.]MDM7956868.1 extensin family protein [Blastomonas sp.]
MTRSALPDSNPLAASPLPGSAVDIAGSMPADAVSPAVAFAALAQPHLAATSRVRRHRCETRKADPRFHASPGSPEMQRMALVAALSVLISGCSVLPEGRVLSRAPVSRPATASAPAALPAPSRTETRQCIAALTQAQVRFTPVPDQTFGAGCSQLGSVRLSTISLTDAQRGANELAISNIGPVRCELAQRFAGWAQFGIARAAEQTLGSPLVRIETMGSYACRNIAGSVKLSQHAHANAIDIAAFVLADGRRITVKQGWNGSNQERAFLRTIHASACKRFGTVLGPDYNAAHRDHLHVDMSGQGYCR